MKPNLDYKPIIQSLISKLFSEKKITLDVLRLDLIHPEVSGNKWFKLKYNLQAAQKTKNDTILTFGGAFSNHIAATAAACKLFGFKSIGVIRGEESSASNPTLQKAQQNGMQLHFVSREQYRQKEETTFIKGLSDKFGKFYLIPEGGNNHLGILGCSEILNEQMNHDLIYCAVGTGATFNGLSKRAAKSQRVIGVKILKDNLTEDDILNDYHFGGYAKHSNELLLFKEEFENEFQIPLDHVYTSKLFYGVFDRIKNNKIPEGSSVLVIHSGGLQGNEGFTSLI